MIIVDGPTPPELFYGVKGTFFWVKHYVIRLLLINKVCKTPVTGSNMI